MSAGSKKTPVVEEQTSTSPPAPSYASLDVDAFLKSQPAMAAVKVGDNLPVFLPITAGVVDLSLDSDNRLRNISFLDGES